MRSKQPINVERSWMLVETFWTPQLLMVMEIANGLLAA
jgi:hypothetical protein